MSLAAEPVAAPTRRKTSAKPKAKGDLPQKLIIDALEDAKAEEVVVIDVSQKTTFADVMILASGRSSVHVAAIADRVARALKTQGAGPPRVEGLASAEWVLIDGGSAIIHVFRPDTRLFYNLEKLWGEGRPDEGRPAPAPKPAARPSKPAGGVPKPAPVKRKAKPQ